jgi:hypothetical protein
MHRSKPLVHSITASATASSLSGTVRPSALVVFKLIINSYLVGAWTGRVGRFLALKDSADTPKARVMELA